MDSLSSYEAYSSSSSSTEDDDNNDQGISKDSQKIEDMQCKSLQHRDLQHRDISILADC